MALYTGKLHYLLPQWHGSSQELYSYAFSLYNNYSGRENDYSDVLILDALFWLFYNPNARKIFKNELTLTNVERIINNCLMRHPDSDMVKIKGGKIVGSLLYFEDSYAEAEKIFVNITKLDPENHSAWFMLGQLYYRGIDKAKESIPYFDKAIKLKPEEGWYYRERGWASMRAGLYPQCVKDLSKAMASGYKSKSVVSAREKCQALLGKSSKKNN